MATKKTATAKAAGTKVKRAAKQDGGKAGKVAKPAKAKAAKKGATKRVSKPKAAKDTAE